MGLMKRLFGGGPTAAERTERLVVEAGVADAPGDLVEIEAVGESYHQDALERIAGPKEADGKEVRVGVTLRREPENEYDANAVRVEVMGQLVGHVAREMAEQLSPALAPVGGAIETQGIIVGGWRDRDSEGSYGIRVWLDSAVAVRLGVQHLRPVPREWDQQMNRIPPLPSLPPPTPGELRLSPPSDSDEYTSTLTVTCEEHYQPALIASRPDAEDRGYWNALASTVLVERNPHAKSADPCIEVRVNNSTVGYLTPAMSRRYEARVQGATARGLVATAEGWVSQGTKGGQAIWRIKLTMPKEPKEPKEP